MGDLQPRRHDLRWHRDRPDLSLSVNVSPRQLEDTGLATMLATAVRDVGLDPRSLWLEVSESAVAGNPELALRTLQALKGVGVRIALDDYGVGASSLGVLKRLPLDALKIHESFVRGLDGDPEAPSLVGAVIELAHALGIKAIAEGVETDAQLGQLVTLGCDGVQGFLLSHPVSQEKAGAMLAAP